ncbi:MAG TPA: PQQ-dependent sugar dehydrogenase [Gemmatimonadales bacterium]|nr:PQQ-dependent sugar dehydrogenase [Gemmatimonadales bacterium]
MVVHPRFVDRAPLDGTAIRGRERLFTARPWPIISYGREYTGEAVGAGLSERDGLEQPVYYWLPSIAVWHSTEGGAGGALI